MRLLTRHFFRALFDFGVFTQEGADAFVRVIIGLLALLITLGLALVRLYAKKYVALSMAAVGAPYADALLADTTLVIALPMWIVALVAVLVSHSLFPDETDFRVLMPLPVRQHVVFGAKLAALALFAGLFTATTIAALTPLALRIAIGRWAVDAAPISVIAFWAAGAAGSVFSLLAVVALNGVLIICVPRRRVYGVSAAVRSAMLGGLALALPFVLALPAYGAALAGRSRLFFLVPPAWFMGVHRLLLGHRDPYFVRLAIMAAGGFVGVAAVSAASYAMLYGRFDRVMLRSFGVSRLSARRRRASRRPVRTAVVQFTTATLRRSALHQGVAIGLAACGAALAASSLVRNGVVAWLRGFDVPQRQLVETVAWIPFPLVIFLGIAARASLALPIESKANWVFRMTERDAIRADELSAAERLVSLFAVWLPVALTLPFQWMVAGPPALVAAALTAAIALLWAEVLLHGWRRIPFTCSYMPGQHTVAQSTVVGVSVFFVGGAIGSELETIALGNTSPRSGLATVLIVSSVAAILRVRRRRAWREVPLMFDAELPSDVVQAFRV